MQSGKIDNIEYNYNADIFKLAGVTPSRLTPEECVAPPIDSTPPKKVQLPTGPCPSLSLPDTIVGTGLIQAVTSSTQALTSSTTRPAKTIANSRTSGSRTTRPSGRTTATVSDYTAEPTEITSSETVSRKTILESGASNIQVALCGIVLLILVAMW